MKYHVLLFAILILGTPFQSVRAEKKWVSLNLLAPTQFTIGEIAMRDKVKTIQKKEREGKLTSYLIKKVAPAYLGPNGRYYIFDRHHTSRALFEAHTHKSTFFIDVLKDYSDLTMEAFYKKLLEEKKVYLKKEGIEQSITELPHSIIDLTNDPYRSLSWLVREAKGFNKVNTPYLEFMWADFFRSRLLIAFGTEKELKKLLKRVLILAKSEEASHLPGHISAEFLAKTSNL